MNEPADFVVLGMDRTAVYGCGDVEAMMDALGVDNLRQRVSDASRFQVWYTLTTPVPNPLSEHVLTALGYYRPGGWTGPIILTTREDDLSRSQPFADDIRERVNELVYAAGGTVTSTPAMSATATADPTRAAGTDPDRPEGTELAQKPREITMNILLFAEDRTVTSTPAMSATAKADPTRAPGTDPDPAGGAEPAQKPAEIAAAIDAALSGPTSDPAQLDPLDPDNTPPGTHPTTHGPDMA
ncbi:hypothetical protein ACWDYH_31230 [Nocardia goodfellowii]